MQQFEIPKPYADTPNATQGHTLPRPEGPLEQNEAIKIPGTQQQTVQRTTHDKRGSRSFQF
jgi:hypothetical protein